MPVRYLDKLHCRGMLRTPLIWRFTLGLLTVLYGEATSWGSTTTGNWVTDGMMFFLQDVSGGKALEAANTLATVRITLQQA